MRVRLLGFAIVLAAGLLTPRTSAAAPVRLEFAGSWRFYDGFFESPVAADFWNAMNESGVFQGSPLILSLLVHDRDLDPDPTRGLYMVTGSVHVGAVNLRLQPTYLEVRSGDIILVGSLVGPRAGSYTPFFFQFGNDSAPVAGDGLISAVAELDANRSFLFVGYQSAVCGICLGFSQPILTRMEVHPSPRAHSLY
jgi:hypothetical protein